MGFMLSRPSFSATLADALEKGRQNLSEYKGLEMVLDCSRCYTRLAPLEWKADRWTVVTPADRFVSPFFGSPYVRCRICGERNLAPTLPTRRVRPFSVLLAATYASVVERARSIVEQLLAGHCALHLTEMVIRRSALADPQEKDLPSPPLELALLVHKVSGARNPITDSKGLYTAWLERVWVRVDVVVVLLLDVTPAYLATMLEEQPTLRGLYAVGRLIPVFSDETADVRGEEPGMAKTEAGFDSTDSLPTPQVAEETSRAPLAESAVPPAPSSRRSSRTSADPYWLPLLRRELRGRVPVCESFEALKARGRSKSGPIAPDDLRTLCENEHVFHLVSG